MIEPTGEDVKFWLRRAMKHDIAVNPNLRRQTMTQDTIFKKGGDLYHGACLTEALKEDATEVPVDNLENDDVCASCGDPVVGEEEIGGDEPQLVKDDEDDAA